MNQYQFFHYLYLFLSGITIFSTIILINHSDERIDLYGYVLEGWEFTFYVIGLFIAIAYMMFMAWYNLTASKIKNDVDASGKIC